MNQLSNISLYPATLPLLAKPELDRISQAVDQTIGFTTRARLTLMLGYLNNLLYCVAKAEGMVDKVGKEFQVSSIANRLKEGLQVITVPLTYTKEFLAECWGDAINSLSSIRIVRSLFENLGLFEYDRHKYQGRHLQSEEDRLKATYRNFNVPLALLVYEHLERRFVEMYGFDALPHHKGGFCKLLYDAIFTIGLGMSRQNSEAGHIPVSEQEAALERAERALAYRQNAFLELQRLRDTIEEFVHTGLHNKAVEVFGQMRDRVQELSARLKRSSGSPQVGDVGVEVRSQNDDFDLPF